MKNRISKFMKNDNQEKNNLNTFFIACEFKPNSELFSVLDPFAYDIKPAFIYGSLGVINYEPESYAIIDAREDDGQILLGYIVTITHPETVMLLEKIKGYNGPDAFNTHQKKLVKAYTDIEESQNAWCFILSEEVLNFYHQIEEIEYLWDEYDDDLLDLLEKIEESL